MDFQKYSLIGVDPVVITSDKKIVLALRGPDAEVEIDKWHIPGALVLADETLENALKRSAKEKTGLEIGLYCNTLRESFVNMYDALVREPRYRDVALSFLCRVEDGEMKPGPRMKEVRAFRPDEIPDLKIGFDHKYIVLEAVAEMKKRGYI